MTRPWKDMPAGPVPVSLIWGLSYKAAGRLSEEDRSFKAALRDDVPDTTLQYTVFSQVKTNTYTLSPVIAFALLTLDNH
jgi:hypothetical protein